MFPEIKAFVTAHSDPPPKRKTYYIVLAADNTGWAHPGAARGLYLTKEEADKVAAGLASCWKYKCIVTIPGD